YSRTTLNFSAMLGIYKDVSITHNQFGLIGSMVFLGQVAFQLPVIFFLQRFPLSKMVGVAMLCWGVSLGGTAFTNSFAQLATCRFLLGGFEAFTYPSLYLFIKTHYRRLEQGTYLALISEGLCISGICGTTDINAFYICITEAGFMHGRGNWAWCMLVFGAAAVCFSVIVFVLLPDTPYSKRFLLTPDEKGIVAERIADNKVSRITNIRWPQIIESLKEPRYYNSLLLLSFLSNLSNGAMSVFRSQLFNDLGFLRLDSILLNIPSSVYELIILIIFIFTKTRIRWCSNHVAYSSALFTIIPVVAVIVLRTVPADKVPIVCLFAIYLTAPGYATLGAQVLLSSNVAGRTKMIFYSTSITFSNTLSHFTRPLMMAGREAPSYPSALTVFIVADGRGTTVAILLFIYIGWSFQSENRKRDRKQLELDDQGVHIKHHAAAAADDDDYDDDENLTTFNYRISDMI
ncbi:major facilitator superfamily domain-containing protein, partial [Zychaea mexicana]|uniref:major facilitator superfamily domain-containing protein n=1 Tax=Zychaea mexicana TaxID=64656 RepID=UPI0022FF140A